MNTGQFRDEVIIQEPYRTASNELGEPPQPIWLTFATARTLIQPLSGRQLEVARSFEHTVSHRVVIRYIPGVSKTHRLYSGGRAFTINAILNADERGSAMFDQCRRNAG